MSQNKYVLVFSIAVASFLIASCSGGDKSAISEEQAQLIKDTNSTTSTCEYSEEKNGWAATVEMTNTTGNPIDSLTASVDFLDSNENVIGFATADFLNVAVDQQVSGETFLANKKVDPGETITPLAQDAEVTSCIVSKLSIAEIRN